MKKLKLITILSLIASLGFAANINAEDTQTTDLYGVYYNNVGEFVSGYHDENGNWVDGYNPTIGSWHIDHADVVGGNLKNPYDKTTLFTAIADKAVLSVSIERNYNANPFTFGTYTYDAEGNPVITETLGSVTKKGDTGLSFYNTEVYNKDQMIGIWIRENGSDTIYYSGNIDTLKQGIETGQYTEGYVEEKPATGYASVWFDIANTGTWGGQEVDGDELGLTEIKFHITGASPDDAGKVGTGGPLPGVFVTLLISGVFGGTYLRNKKK